MTAYALYDVAKFLSTDVPTVVGTLQTRYAHDGFASQYTQQTKAWEQFVPLLRDALSELVSDCPEVLHWGILLEYPLYRLRKRIDCVILAGDKIVVLEAKVGDDCFRSEDERQVEEYTLDLRDFHAGCAGRTLVPVLWCTKACAGKSEASLASELVWPVLRAGANELASILRPLVSSSAGSALIHEQWDTASYRPVPTIIQAATTIFAGHNVRAIAQADASNLRTATGRIIEIVSEARHGSKKAVVFLTGVPGAGKTLAGLQVVHDAVTTGAEDQGDIVYLSGNTPLVVVLREALARDIVRRSQKSGAKSTLRKERQSVRARIQHINDFLKQYLTGTQIALPHEHAIVFDEAQRAWDADQGAKKFDRQKSEPGLLLEIMGMHRDWCACICLVGGGQEINTGEEGIRGWGDAIRALPESEVSRWTIYGPDDVFKGGVSTGGLSLGTLPSGIRQVSDQDLRLTVPLRTYRSPAMSDWVTAMLEADLGTAKTKAQLLTRYPIIVTRSLEKAKVWLRQVGRGERRYGLLASSGARRLRADGLGEILKATHGPAIAQWYLNERDDIRSSFVLEVPANEYACQGLELDFGCVCWGGDLVFSARRNRFLYRHLSGNKWNETKSELRQRFVRNTYRVLLTRAREGLIIWVPNGDSSDRTRKPEELDATAEFLVACGAQTMT